MHKNAKHTAAILILSDKGFRGERQDLCMDIARKYLQDFEYDVVEERLIPDDYDGIVDNLKELADGIGVDLIVTSGGTGFSLRDHTPEATLAVATRNVPGIAEAMRSYSLRITPHAMLSRAVSVLRNQTLIVNFPGSPKALEEMMELILPPLGHGLDVLKGSAGDCAK